LLPYTVAAEFNKQPYRSLAVVTAPSVSLTYLKIDWIITGHHKNLDTIGRQNYQEPGVEAELNFEFFEFAIISSK